MVRVASSFVGAAVAFSSYVAAAPAGAKRQGDISVAAGGALSTIDPNAIPTDAGSNDSAGNSIEFNTSTDSNSIQFTDSSSNSVQFTDTGSDSTIISTVGVHTSITTIQNSYPQYGSGSNSWMNSYNECMQICFQSNPLPSTVVSLPPSSSESSSSGCSSSDCSISSNESSSSGGGESSSSSSGSSSSSSNDGNVLNIMLEPVNGVLRIVPPFVNAQAGQIVRFQSVNGNHAIAQSSPITPCNATTGGFASQTLAPGQTFDFTVQDSTTPIFFFSTIDGECQAGMFGGINAATGDESSQTTVSALLPTWAQANPDIQTALSMTNSLAANTQGLSWGGKIDTAPIAPEMYPQLANSILFNRMVMGRNPELVNSTSGNLNPSGNVSIPSDPTSLIAVANQGGYDYQAPLSSSDTPTAAAGADNAAAQATDAPGDGAGSIISSTSSKVAVGALAMLGAVLFL